MCPFGDGYGWRPSKIVRFFGRYKLWSKRKLRFFRKVIFLASEIIKPWSDRKGAQGFFSSQKPIHTPKVICALKPPRRREGAWYFWRYSLPRAANALQKLRLRKAGLQLLFLIAKVIHSTTMNCLFGRRCKGRVEICPANLFARRRDMLQYLTK